MKISYVANVRMPTEKAHGVQIMKSCEALSLLGHEVVLLVPKRTNPIRENPFTYYTVKPIFTISKRWTLDTVGLEKLGFILQSVTFALAVRFALPKGDVIYGRDEIVLAVLAFLGVRNIVWESHDGAWNCWARFLAARLSRLVVVSKGACDIYIERGINFKKILVLPNGVDLADFSNPESKDASRARLGLPLDKEIVMYIGRLDGWKGAGTLLEASKTLPDNVLTVVIGGEDEQVAGLSARYPRVRFLGYRPYRELADNQSAADVLVVPNTAKDPISVQFTSPLKIFAHMASGRPIVASNLPSIREIVGEDAYLVAPDNPSALSTGIITALSDSQRSVVANRARERIRSFSWERRAHSLSMFLSDGAL